MNWIKNKVLAAPMLLLPALAGSAQAGIVEDLTFWRRREEPVACEVIDDHRELGAEISQIVDTIPDDVDGLFIRNVDEIMPKISQCQIESVEVTRSESRMNPGFVYKFTLKNGNNIFMPVPTDEASNDKLVTALKAYGDEPVHIQIEGSGDGFKVTDLVSMIFPLAILYFLAKNSGIADGIGGGDKFKVAKKTGVNLDDVRGNPQNVAMIKNVISIINNLKENKVDAKVPKGILFYGPPGTGKTYMAKAIAGETDSTFIQVSASDIGNVWAGLGANQVKKLFKKARSAAKNTGKPVIIYIDEFDAIGRKRHNGPSTGGAVDDANKTLNALLKEMDGFDGNDNIIVMASTNRLEALDPAAIRDGRFDYKIPIVNPVTAAQRADILALEIEKRQEGGTVANDVSIDELAKVTPGFSPVELVKLSEKAAFNAYIEGRDVVTTEDYNEAIKTTRVGSKTDIKVDDELLRKIVAHELGHLVNGLAADLDMHDISLEPRGQSLAHVTSKTSDSENLSATRSMYLAHLVMALGGRAADNVITKDANAGAAQDFQQARMIIRSMISSNMLGNTSMNDYTESSAQLTREDKEIAEKVFDKAQKAAERIVEVFGPETISNMTDELFDVVRVAGKDLDAFIDKHTSKGQRDGAKVIFANFKKDPFDTDGSLEPSPQRAA